MDTWLLIVMYDNIVWSWEKGGRNVSESTEHLRFAYLNTQTVMLLEQTAYLYNDNVAHNTSCMASLPTASLVGTSQVTSL